MKNSKDKKDPNLVHVGIDFHWHSWEDAGKNFNEDEFRAEMTSLTTRFVYITAKCANGWSYYPTKYGISHPNLAGDYFGRRLKILREIGYTVIAYYCIGLEGPVLQKHPEWQLYRRSEDFKENIPDDSILMANLESPYFEELALPQIGEIIRRYGVAGIWLDIFHPDNGNINYTAWSKRNFEAAMHRPLLPPDEDPNYLETWRYFRERGSEFRKKIRDEIKSVSPECRLAINYAYSCREPYLDFSDVDYLSADPCKPSVGNSFETGFFARYAAQTGLDADIHTTSCATWGEWDLKGLPFMQREAAISIANGAKYMLWEYHNPDGSLNPARMGKVRKVEKFIADREESFRTGEITGDIVVLSTVAAYEDQKPGVFRDREVYESENRHVPSCCVESAYGASFLLQYSGRSFVFANEDNLSGKLENASVVILPKQTVIPPDIAAQLKEFVENGGKLIAVGAMPETVASWSGLTCESPLPLNLSYYKLPVMDNDYNGEMICCFSDFAPVSGDGAKAVAEYFHPAYFDAVVTRKKEYMRGFSPAGKESCPAALQKNIGKGCVILCGGNLFEGYFRRGSALLIRMLDHLLESCNYLPRVKTVPNRGIEIVERTAPGKHIIHFINQLEANNFPAMAAYLPPVANLEISVAARKEPRKILLIPDMTNLEFSRQNGAINFTIPRLDIHKAVEINY